MLTSPGVGFQEGPTPCTILEDGKDRVKQVQYGKGSQNEEIKGTGCVCGGGRGWS